jgi:HK97 family phage portal protein
MAYTHNGYRGISVLSRASEVIAAGRAAQRYNLNYYANGGQPAGVLETVADLSGDVEVTRGETTEMVSRKDVIRAEWEKRYSGPDNAGRIAILDYGLKYNPISISNRDAQFVEQSALSVEDIARFFGVPLYKLQAGKQAYDSNEQNAIEYVVSTLHPIVQQWEEELTWKLLPSSEAARLKIRINMMAELRGDNASRGQWYKSMRELGGYSTNDILALEDMPDVEGGDERYASLNYVPLSLWRDLSINRNSNENETTGGQEE